jgi:hypothetical protein
VRRRVRDDDATTPPADLLRFDGDAYFHDPKLWERKFAAWCAARDEWETDHGIEIELEPGAIGDAPFNPDDL